MSRPKVFGIGFSKTGTTTLAKVMERLGYMNYNYDRYYLKLIKQNRIDEIWKWVDPWDSFQDIPWPLIYRELDQQYPGSKFILTVRDEEKWWNSALSEMGWRNSENVTLVYGASNPKGNKDLFMSIYRKHNAGVREYFADRPEDLLVMDWEKQGVADVCRFLGKDIPINRFTGRKMPTGHYNKAELKSRQGYQTILLGRELKSLGKKAVVDLFGSPALTFFNRIRFFRYWIKLQFLSLVYKKS